MDMLNFKFERLRASEVLKGKKRKTRVSFSLFLCEGVFSSEERRQKAPIRVCELFSGLRPRVMTTTTDTGQGLPLSSGVYGQYQG
jgi:hypothetical protein